MMMILEGIVMMHIQKHMMVAEFSFDLQRSILVAWNGISNRMSM